MNLQSSTSATSVAQAQQAQAQAQQALQNQLLDFVYATHKESADFVESVNVAVHEFLRSNSAQYTDDQFLLNTNNKQRSDCVLRYVVTMLESKNVEDSEILRVAVTLPRASAEPNKASLPSPNPPQRIIQP